jgi:hypothetical protein
LYFFSNGDLITLMSEARLPLIQRIKSH